MAEKNEHNAGVVNSLLKKNFGREEKKPGGIRRRRPVTAKETARVVQWMLCHQGTLAPTSAAWWKNILPVIVLVNKKMYSI